MCSYDCALSNSQDVEEDVIRAVTVMKMKNMEEAKEERLFLPRRLLELELFLLMSLLV